MNTLKIRTQPGAEKATGGSANVIVTAETDMIPNGAFGQKFPVVTQDRLRVYEPAKGSGTLGRLRVRRTGRRLVI